jgi:hypothetical protein
MKVHKLSDYELDELKIGKAFIAKVVRDHIELNFEKYIDNLFKQLYACSSVDSDDTINIDINFTFTAGLLLASMRKKG